MVEVEDVPEVGRAIDRMQAQQVLQTATLGQHTNDRMISFYMRTPSNFDIEFGCGGAVIDWHEHIVHEFTRVSLWGHDFSVGNQTGPDAMADKRMSAADAVAQLKDGMTLGIGGWGPRRKPMALVREILRSPLKDLTVVAYGGADVGMLCAAGKVKKLVFAFVSLDFIPLEPYFRIARQSRRDRGDGDRRGPVHAGLKAAGMRVPFIPTRVGLGTDVLKRNPADPLVDSPYDERDWVAMPALPLDAALLHVDRADARGVCQVKGPDLYMDDLFARAAKQTYVSCDELVDQPLSQGDEARYVFWERAQTTGVVHMPCGAHPSSCAPLYGFDVKHFKEYAASAKEEGGWAKYYERYIACGEANTSSAWVASRRCASCRCRCSEGRDMSDISLVDRIICAAAQAWAHDGEVLATGIGIVPRLAPALCMLQSTRPDDDRLRGLDRARAGAGGPARARRLRRAARDHMGFARIFDNVWGGKRHAMVGPTQIDRFGQANISMMGSDYARPKSMMLGVRGFPGNSINHANSFFVPNHSPKVFVPGEVDMVASVGYNPARLARGWSLDEIDIRLVITNLCVMDFGGPGPPAAAALAAPGRQRRAGAAGHRLCGRGAGRREYHARSQRR
jgi:glutaconate CoA-transferase subunit A